MQFRPSAMTCQEEKMAWLGQHAGLVLEDLSTIIQIHSRALCCSIIIIDVELRIFKRSVKKGVLPILSCDHLHFKMFGKFSQNRKTLKC